MKPEKDDKLTLKIKPSRKSEEVEVIPDSEEDGDEGIDDDDDGYDSPGSQKTPPRITRSSNQKKELPFSPRKSKSQRVLPVAESDSDAEESEVEEMRPLRRSTRAKKTTEINLVSEDDEHDNDDYNDSLSKGHKKAKPKKKAKSTQPMYGHFRSITTLDEDPFSDDEENQALRQHRLICEKCHLGPAHQLLAAFKKRSKGKGRKRKRGTDDEFEESEGEERYNSLGGWVRWCVQIHPFSIASSSADFVQIA